MDAQIDAVTVKDLEARYNVNRSNIYKRLKALQQKGYPMEPEKVEGRAIYNRDQLMVLDLLESHMRRGLEIRSFPRVGEPQQQPEVSRSLARQSRETEDTLSIAPFAPAIDFEGLTDLAKAIASLAPPPPPLANLEAIEKAYQAGWHLSTSQLAPLLGRKSLSGKQIQRFGFTFTKVGKNGAESAWSISKDE